MTVAELLGLRPVAFVQVSHAKPEQLVCDCLGFSTSQHS